MTVTTQQIKSELNGQAEEYAKGVIDVSEKLIKQGVGKLKQQGLTEQYATSLMTKFFKIPDKNGRDSIIKMYGAGKCVTVNAEYLSDHFSTDNRVLGKGIGQCLAMVVGYAHFPNQGVYVREAGAVYYNIWRHAAEMFSGDEYYDVVMAGYDKYFANHDLWVKSEGKLTNDVDLRDVLKPKVWLAMEKLWFPNKPEEADIFTDWLSLVVTFPDYRTRWTPVLRSVHGIGKGSLVQEVLRPLLGAHTVKEVDYKRTVGAFSGELFLNRLIVMNEVEATSPEQYNRLKTIVSDDYHFVERKGEQPFDAKMTFATLMFSNKEKPLSIPKGDRRYWLPDFIKYPELWGETDAEQQAKAAEFFGYWRTALAEGGLKDLAIFLRWLALDRAEIHDTAPASEGKDDIVSNRTEDASDKLVIYLQAKWHKGEGLKVSDLQSLFSPSLSDADVQRVLVDQGYVPGRHTIAGKQMRCWTKDGEAVDELHKPQHR